MSLSKYDLNWRSILIKQYKNYGIDEKALVVIFCLDEILKENKALISAEELQWMMTISKSEIDSILATLLSKKIIGIETYNGKKVTSLNPLFDKILNNTKNDIIIESKDQKRVDAKEKGEHIYNYFETQLGRTLTSGEFDKICSWFLEGASEGMIKEAVEVVRSKSKRITIKAVDQALLAIEKNKDITVDGFTTRSVDWRESPDQTIEQIRAKWIPDEK